MMTEGPTCLETVIPPGPVVKLGQRIFLTMIMFEKLGEFCLNLCSSCLECCGFFAMVVCCYDETHRPADLHYHPWIIEYQIV